MWIAAAVWAAAFGILDWWRWASYHAGGDFALFVQTIASGFPSYHNMVEIANHFSVHFSPVYALFTPLMAPAQTVTPLFVAAGVAGALTGPGVYLLARRVMPAGCALGAAAIAFFYPPLAGVIFGDPYETIFAPAATVWLLYGFEARKPAVIVVAALSALALKEDQGLFLAVTGAFMALRHRRTPALARYGAGVAAAGCVTFAAYVLVLRPHLTSDPGHGMWIYDWRHAAGDIAPWYSPLRPAYLLEALVPLLFVPLRSPFALLAVPPLIEVLASPYTLLFSTSSHYPGVWIGYVLAAEVDGLATLRSERTRRLLAGVSLALCIAQFALANPAHFRVNLSLPNAHDRALDRILAGLPREASIATYEQAYSHLGFFPNAVAGLRGTPALVVIDTTRPSSYFVPVLERYVNEHPGYVRRTWTDGIAVFAARGSSISLRSKRSPMK